MNYGLHISASGMLTSLYRQDVASNNLANINTAGFKPDLAFAIQRDAARIEDGLASLPSNRLLERLGAGAMLAPNRVSLEQGPLQTTTNPLDLAIDGEGFFVVRDEGEGPGALRLTRDGRFTRDASGRLVMAASGLPVMDESGSPITIPEGAAVTVDADGSIRQGGETIARLRLVRVTDPAAIAKHGHSLMSAPAHALAPGAPGMVRQHAVEGAAIDPIGAMMAVASASRDAEANAGMIRSHDHLMDRAINVLGRIS